MTLVGHGVQPVISLIPDTDVLDWGHVIAGDTVTRTLQLTNTSQLTVKYNAILERLRPLSIAQGTYIKSLYTLPSDLFWNN